MPKSSNQKLKLLYLLRILQKETDEEHYLNSQQLIERLEKYDISAERKSIYDDIARLTDFGYDIIHVKTKGGSGYYMGSREFELAELKLLVDVVQASRFITLRKSRELINKLEQFVSGKEAQQLQRQVYVAGRVKTDTESIYYNVDFIHRAIQENRQISLMKHYRVDKMGSIELTREERQGSIVFENFDIAVYTNKTFGMYGGREEIVSLVFADQLIGVVLDRFGRETDIRRLQEGTFRVRVKVAVSGQFFGWLTGLGTQVRLAGPENVVEEYRNYLKKIYGRYEEGCSGQ